MPDLTVSLTSRMVAGLQVLTDAKNVELNEAGRPSITPAEMFAAQFDPILTAVGERASEREISDITENLKRASRAQRNNVRSLLGLPPK
jgi:hypothetical protein